MRLDGKLSKRFVIFPLKETNNDVSINEEGTDSSSKRKSSAPKSVFLRSDLRRAFEEASKLYLRRIKASHRLSIVSIRDIKDEIDPVLDEIKPDQIGEIQTYSDESKGGIVDTNPRTNKPRYELNVPPPKEKPESYQRDIDLIKQFRGYTFIVKRDPVDLETVEVLQLDTRQKIIAPILNYILKDVFDYDLPNLDSEEVVAPLLDHLLKELSELNTNTSSETLLKAISDGKFTKIKISDEFKYDKQPQDATQIVIPLLNAIMDQVEKPEKPAKKKHVREGTTKVRDKNVVARHKAEQTCMIFRVPSKLGRAEVKVSMKPKIAIKSNRNIITNPEKIKTKYLCPKILKKYCENLEEICIKNDLTKMRTLYASKFTYLQVQTAAGENIPIPTLTCQVNKKILMVKKECPDLVGKRTKRIVIDLKSLRLKDEEKGRKRNEETRRNNEPCKCAPRIVLCMKRPVTKVIVDPICPRKIILSY